MKQFKSRKQNRLNNYDYSSNGYYYVTICTYKREYIFGEIINDEMILNQCGNIAKKSWRDLPNHHIGIELDQFIWQKSFHDHIIRVDDSLNNVRNYIINNPKTWEMDENNINSLEVQAGLNPTG